MRKYLFALLILLFPIEGFAQESKFVVLTFSVKVPYDKITWEYYWITPFDSISAKSSILQNLIPFAADDSFLEENPIGKWQCTSLWNGFIWMFKKVKGDFTPQRRLIAENRKHIQTIKRKWELSGLHLNIKVYATPIIGKIDICRQKYLEMEYNKKFYLYYTESPIEYWPEFWETDEAKEIADTDYASIDFDLNVDYGYMRGAR